MPEGKTDDLILELCDKFASWDRPETDGRSMGAGRYTKELFPFPKLFSPLSLGGLSLMSRTALLPTGVCPLAEGNETLTEEVRRFYLDRALGGVSLLATWPISAEVKPDPATFLRWRGLTEAVHARGAKLFLQLSLGAKPEQLAVLAASSLAGGFDGLCLDTRDALDTAVDSVWLIRRQIGPELPILCRVSLSPALYESFGEQMGRDKALKKMKKIPSVGDTLNVILGMAQAGADGMEVGLGCKETPWLRQPPAWMPAGCYLELSRAVRDYLRYHGRPLPVIASGHLGYPDCAERALQSSLCDMINLDGEAARDKDWCRKVKAGQLQEIGVDTKPVGLVEQSKQIAVIGGGCGGMRFALHAAERGHQIELYEAEDQPGGVLAALARPALSYEDRALLEHLTAKCRENEHITWKLGTRADTEMLKKHGYDALVFTDGTKAAPAPGIPGWGDIPFLTAAEVMRHPAMLPELRKKRVIVLGGGELGCLCAWWLQTERGCKRATVLTAEDDFMPERPEADRSWFVHHFPLRGGKLVRGASPRRIKRGCLIAEDLTRGRLRYLSADLILLAEDAAPDDRLYREALRESAAGEIYRPLSGKDIDALSTQI